MSCLRHRCSVSLLNKSPAPARTILGKPNARPLPFLSLETRKDQIFGILGKPPARPLPSPGLRRAPVCPVAPPCGRGLSVASSCGHVILSPGWLHAPVCSPGLRRAPVVASYLFFSFAPPIRSGGVLGCGGSASGFNTDYRHWVSDLRSPPDSG